MMPAMHLLTLLWCVVTLVAYKPYGIMFSS
jgi:hypothetical protein